MVYLDTSVVVAYYVPELLSDLVQQTYVGQEALALSELVELEVFAALSLRRRIGDLEQRDVERVGSLFLSHLEGGYYTRLGLRAEHYRLARSCISRFDPPLKAPDALHLAVCAAAGFSLMTADRQLASNAEALDVDVKLIRGA